MANNKKDMPLRRIQFWKRIRDTQGPIVILLSIFAIYVGGLFSIANIFGLSWWSGLFLAGSGIGTLVYFSNPGDIEPSLEERSRAAATLERKTFSELVNDALREYLDKHHQC